MKAWHIHGSLFIAVLPIIELSTGTSRQPRTVCPSVATIFSKTALLLARVASSGEQ
ncbi:MAG: hypothetical protein QM796_11130 [Chthoniobacteraceae bacterium]